MPVANRPALPPGLRRAALRGGLAGAGLLVTAAGLTPVVVAGDDAASGNGPAPDVTPDTADAVAAAPLLSAPALSPASASSEPLSGNFGTGKQAHNTDFGTVGALGLFVAGSGGEAPAGASTDGSVIEFTNAAGAVAGHCTSHHLPSSPADLSLCLIGVTGGDVAPETGPDGEPVDTIAPGNYTVRQSSAAPGFAVQAGVIGTVTFDPDSTDGTPPSFVLDPAVFGHSLAVSLTRAGTGAPVPGAAYTVTGPDWPAPPTSDGPDGSDGPGIGLLSVPLVSATIGPSGTKTWGPATSGPDGILTFGDGDADWFAPGGSYTLTPVTIPSGYRAESAGPLVVSAAATDGGPVTATHALAPVVVAGDTPVAAPAAPSTSSPSTTQSTTTTTRHRTSVPASATPAPESEPPATPSGATLQPGNALPQSDRDAGQAVVATPPLPQAPALTTRSSTAQYTSILTFGIPMVAALIAVILFLLRRRRDRYQHQG